MVEKGRKKAEQQKQGKRQRYTSGKRVSSQRRSPRSGRDMPPVLSRNNIGINTVAVEEGHSPRRRYDVPLSSPGAEIRFPAVPTVQNYWRVVSGVLSVALLAALILMWNAPYFQVRSVGVDGVQRFSAGEISRAINAVGNPAFTIHPNQLERDLEMTYSGFESIDVQVMWPDQVKVIVEERDPVIAWDWEGHVRWIDEEGIGFDPHGESEDLITVKSPILPSTSGRQFLSSALAKAIVDLAAYAPDGAPMVYDPERGLGWKDNRGWQVYFGADPNDMGRKMVVYRSIVEHLEGKGIQPSLISVEHLRAPYFRMGQ